MRDINLECGDLKSQIDFVVVTSHHCYFIECKNYNADIIHVDETGNFEISTRYGKKYNKLGIKSPISQAEDQLVVFKKICLNDQDTVKQLLSNVKFQDYFKTMVVFTNSENRLDLKNAPYDIKYRILKVDNLIRQIVYDEEHSKGNNYSQEQMKEIANYILSKNVEVKVEDIKETSYKQYEVINDNSNNNQRNTNNKGKSLGLKSTLIALVVLAIIYFVYGNKSTDVNNKKEIPKVSYPANLTDKQSEALRSFKSAYNDSIRNGFTIIHTSACNEINYFFENDISCNIDPIEVNYENEEEVIFFRPLSKTCYKLSLSSDNKQALNAEYKKVYDGSCSGKPMGMIEWDDNNKFYQKIGGYDKIKELAIYSYTKGMFNVDYFDSSHISERGGNSYNYGTYYQNVVYFFNGVAGNNGGKKDTTKDNFNKMVESYYYIMK